MLIFSSLIDKIEQKVEKSICDLTKTFCMRFFAEIPIKGITWHTEIQLKTCMP